MKTESQTSHLSFEKDSNGIRCLVYREDCVTKTHDGGLKDMRSDHKIVWVHPNDNISRCPVRLTEKYLSLCPSYTKKSNFYLQSLQKFTPVCWYSGQVIGTNTISKVVQTIMKEAKIEGFFTNHSLRRICSTRLFRVGVDQKIVKEVTGHRSNAIEKYQVTSDEQRAQVSKIIAQNPDAVSRENNVKSVKEDNLDDKSVSIGSTNKCKCSVSEGNVTDIIDRIVKETSKKGKTIIRLEIKIANG